MSATTPQRLLDALLHFVFPEVCQACHEQRATPQEGFVCAECWRDLRFIRPPFCQRCGLPFEGDLTTEFTCTNCHDVELHFSSARSAVAARGIVLDLVHRFKYQQAHWAEPFLADLLVREAKPALASGQWDCIAPVPLHAVKERERGFNQAERFARALGKATGLPVKTNLLERHQPTLTQTRLKREERAKNVKQAFSTHRGADLSAQRIVLVDDVFTTGATTNDCARALRRAGAADVCVWTVARGL